ncbi:MAG: endolytic transglycosylase MltG [Desulfobacteraceae bacterium]|nr:endolytic transglycosylase MltG [Desulfobacteraceae bacterium]
MQKPKLKLFLTSFLTLFILLFAGSGILILQIKKFIDTPSNPEAQNQIFEIRPGQSLHRISANLEKENLISNKSLFKIYTRIKGSAKKLQAGEYILSASQSPQTLLATLTRGKVKLYRLTIPEGLNIKEIGQLVETAGFCSKTQFIKLCKDGPFIAETSIHERSLEGYLFPDTYFFPKNSTCHTIILAMAKHFQIMLPNTWKTRAKKLGLTLHEVIILASIIEKETGDAKERPLISSVFHNRLKKGMRLESDPTVIYGIKDFDGNIRRIHLRTKTPYNTYQIKGLPAGPIANPGKKAIEAALFPVKSDYLFFVSKKDTTHKFSKTMEEHNRAVRKYQLRR